jgi:hypothetical protein
MEFSAYICDVDEMTMRSEEIEEGMMKNRERVYETYPRIGGPSMSFIPLILPTRVSHT